MQFSFRAFDKEGVFKSGSIDAPSKEIALSSLQGQSLLVTYISEEGKGIVLKLGARVSIKHLAVFTRELYFLIRSRIPLDDAIETLQLSTQDQQLRTVLKEVRKDLLGGLSFSRALLKHPSIFSPYFTKMVEVGEISGNLDEVLSYLATHLENQDRFMGRVVQAMIYPVMVAILLIGVMIVLFTTVVPRVTQIFKENNLPMPPLTRFFDSVSTGMIHYWMFIVPALVLFVYYVFEYIKTPEGKAYLFQNVYRLPVFGEILKNIYVLRFLESFSFLIKGGITIPDALEISGSSIDNQIYEDALKRSAEEARKGKPISVVLSDFGNLFPPLVLQSVATGEKIGLVGDILFRTSTYYAENLEVRTQTISEVIQPFLIIAMAVVLGLLEASLLIPILNLTKAVQAF